ncbi:MAG: FAD-binding oxidoreductase [Vicinamibacterales bacterium]
MTSRVTAKPPASVAIEQSTDPDLINRFLEDAAHYPGGRAVAVMRPRTIDELSACLRAPQRVLVVGAQSSLTGGATPSNDVVVATELLNTIRVEGDRIRVGAGVPLQAVQETLFRIGRWFPPVPTYPGAFAGGAVATCAAGAATFKYGTVRDWVEGLTVVLAGGDVIDLARGQHSASPQGTFDIETATGVRTIQLPSLKMPDVPKCAAGYFVQPGMDLIDLFIGSEGTLGAIAEVVFKTAPLPGGL